LSEIHASFLQTSAVQSVLVVEMPQEEDPAAVGTPKEDPAAAAQVSKTENIDTAMEVIKNPSFKICWIGTAFLIIAIFGSIAEIGNQGCNVNDGWKIKERRQNSGDWLVKYGWFVWNNTHVFNANGVEIGQCQAGVMTWADKYTVASDPQQGSCDDDQYKNQNDCLRNSKTWTRFTDVVLSEAPPTPVMATGYFLAAVGIFAAVLTLMFERQLPQEQRLSSRLMKQFQLFEK